MSAAANSSFCLRCLMWQQRTPGQGQLLQTHHHIKHQAVKGSQPRKMMILKRQVWMQRFCCPDSELFPEPDVIAIEVSVVVE
jgi:hypothetical protein